MGSLAIHETEGVVSMIEYTSPNGYTGQLYGKQSYRIVDQYGKEVFHTGYRAINTLEELKKDVDSFPAFFETIMKHLQNDD